MDISIETKAKDVFFFVFLLNKWDLWVKEGLLNLVVHIYFLSFKIQLKMYMYVCFDLFIVLLLFF